MNLFRFFLLGSPRCRRNCPSPTVRPIRAICLAAIVCFAIAGCFRNASAEPDLPLPEILQTTPGSVGDRFFVLRDGTDLRAMGGGTTRQLLWPAKGIGDEGFGKKERSEYCRLKHSEDIQWVLRDLENGLVVATGKHPEKTFFGASSSKVFVAAALLDLQNGSISKHQLQLMTKMIAVSSNEAWKALQKMAGNGSQDAGREAVDAFTRKMGYENIRGFQGWLRDEIHGNELNALALSQFLFDTYHDCYPGAEVLWKLMYACRTGKAKGRRYLPCNMFVGGKTGTYDGPNVSPETVPWPEIRARNHIMVFRAKGRQYGLAILSNRGSNDDVAILAGGVVREYLHVPGPLKKKCDQN